MTLLTEARRSVHRVIALLVLPTLEALEESEVELAAAVGLIQEFNKRGPRPALEFEIDGLRRDLRRAALLLRQAWGTRAGMGQAGYSRSGELAIDTAALSRIAVQG